MASVAVRLSHFIAETATETLPKEVVNQVRSALLDHLSSALAGATVDGPRLLADYLRGMRGSDCSAQAGVIGMGLRMPPPDAAFVNGTSAHALEMDDGHRGAALHPGSVVFPTVLALAQARKRATFGDIVSAVVVGYDVMIRLSAGGHPATRYRGFHNTGIAGVFGACAAAARLLRLPPDVTNHALGLAGSFAAGLFAFLQNGADTKKLHAGKSARDGIICAELAERGMTGPADVFEGKDGYFFAYAGQFDRDKILSGLGDDFSVMHIYFKPYPCCRHLHSAIDAVREIKRKKPLNLDQLRAIRIGTYEVAARHSNKDVRNLLDAQMSLPYAVALALIRDNVRLEDFTPGENLAREIRTLMDKILVEVDDRCEVDYPAKRPAIVDIHLLDGTVITQRVDEPWGSKSNPMSEEEIERKFYNVWCIRDEATKGRQVVELVRTADSASAVRHIVDLCVDWGSQRA